MKTDKLNKGIINSLIENSRTDVHSFKNAKAAYRLLAGALLSGYLEIENESVNKSIAQMAKNEGKSVAQFTKSSKFLNDISGAEARNILGKNNELEKINNSLSRKKILFIEDNFITGGWKYVFDCIFKGIDIINTDNQLDSLGIIEKSRYDIACIFLDLRLPDTEEQGLEILKIIKEKYPEIPVIVFSASDSVVYSKRAFELGAWDFFPKEPNDSVNRNPRDYFLTFINLLQRLSAFNTFYVKNYWEIIVSINVALDSYKNESGSGLLNIVKRELPKAYKHMIFGETYKYLPSFLKMDHYDEVIYCSSKAFESMLIFFTIYKKIDTKRVLVKIYGEDGAPTAKTVKEDILNELKGLGSLIDNIQNHKALPKLWVDKAYDQIKIRNKVIHGYRNMHNWRTSETKPTDFKIAADYFKNILDLIYESLKVLKIIH